MNPQKSGVQKSTLGFKSFESKQAEQQKSIDLGAIINQTN